MADTTTDTETTVQPVTEPTPTPTQPVTEPTVTEPTPTPTQPVTEPTVTEPTVTEPTPTPTQPVTESTVTEATPAPTQPVTEPTPPITIDDIINSVECIKVKENSDKATLESIGNTSFGNLKTQLIKWGVDGFTYAYPIIMITIEPPAICSDGVSRNLLDYIQYCSGKTIQEYVAIIQEKVRGIVVSYTRYSSHMAIVVSKP